jgi:hypothetical protein
VGLDFLSVAKTPKARVYFPHPAFSGAPNVLKLDGCVTRVSN